MREQKIRVKGRFHDKKNRDVIRKVDNFGLQRNQALGKSLEIHKDDTS